MGTLNNQEPARNAGRPFWPRLNGILGRIETVLSDLGAIFILLICIYVVLGIFLRSVVGAQIPDEVVIISELMVGALVLPLALVAAQRGFIAVEVFTGRLGARAIAWLGALAAFVGLTAIIPITIAGYLSVSEAIHQGNYAFGQLSLPEWPGKLAFFVGYLVFVVRLTFLFIQDVSVGLGHLGQGRVTSVSNDNSNGEGT